MSLGTKFKAQLDAVFNNTQIASTATLRPITNAIGAYGGYESVTETETANVTVKCIPSNFFGSKKLETLFGNFNAGDVMLIIPGDTTITKEYHVTWKSEDYTVKDIRTYTLNDINVAKAISLAKYSA